MQATKKQPTFRLLTGKTTVGLAAGLSAYLFQMTPASEAAVVTRNINVTLNAANLDTYALDVDQNGTTDFTFQSAYAPDPVLTVGFDQIAFAFGSGNGAVIDAQTGDGFPAASLLVPGNVVSSASRFSTSNDLADLYFYDTLDPTTGNYGGKTGFVGFRFDGVGGTHYGYAQVSVKSLSDPVAPFNLTIGTVVYDNTAGTAVTVTAVPEPMSTGLLATAALTFAGFVRRRRAALV